nr:MAG TPA: hypothetical protein [Caudoviricetes sp.]DAQ63700.1 MAG TPA: hypothetical protein [Caudoviricetes sp.]DAT82260.1 MAG TPA: hypothetical protein [Caudoviricetes sp.]DAZ55494.1 MAG TPA: hypothetical protein [Caudoviricetes sp.]
MPFLVAVHAQLIKMLGMEKKQNFIWCGRE